MKKKQKKQEDLLYKFPTKCAVCKECHLVPYRDGTPSLHCMYGGPFGGYGKVKYNTDAKT